MIVILDKYQFLSSFYILIGTPVRITTPGGTIVRPGTPQALQAKQIIVQNTGPRIQASPTGGHIIRMVKTGQPMVSPCNCIFRQVILGHES